MNNRSHLRFIRLYLALAGTCDFPETFKAHFASMTVILIMVVVNQLKIFKLSVVACIPGSSSTIPARRLPVGGPAYGLFALQVLFDGTN
jgi:hypothetical protein